MRKILLCAVAAVFLTALAVPASAVHIRSAADKGISEIEIGGELLTRGWLFDETYTNDRRGGAAAAGSSATKSNKTNSYWQTNFVLDTAYVASENLKGVWTLEIEDVIWGDDATGGGLGTNGTNVLTNQLFVEFLIPSTPVTAKVGLQNFTLGHSVILDDEAGGLNLNIAVDPLDVNVFTFKVNEENFDEADDIDFYGLSTNISLGDLGSVGIFGIWGHANGHDSTAGVWLETYDTEDFLTAATMPDNYFDRYDAWWYGLTADIAVDPIEIAFEIDAYQARFNAETGNRDFHASGWFTWLDVGANIGDLGKAGIAGFFASGNANDSYLNNDTSNTYVNNNFTQISSWDRTDGTLLDWDNLFIRDGVAYNNSARTTTPTTDNDNTLRNMFSVKAYAALNPTDWLSTGVNTNFYWKTNDLRGNEDGERRFYGFEVDLDVAVQIYDQLVWTVEGGWMFTTDDALDPNAPNRDAGADAIGVDEDKNDELTVDNIWAVTSALVYSF